MYADVVIAQSEQMREVYIELLQKFMRSEDSAGIIDWESKIIGAGSALFDKNIQTGLSEKRVLIYAVTASMIYEAGYESIKKIKKSLEILDRFSDRLKVVWRIDPYAKDILTCRDDDLYEQ